MALEEDEVRHSTDHTPLLSQVGEPTNNGNESSLRAEMLEIVKLGIPQVVVTFFRAWIIGITVFAVGHLGVKELAAASLGLLHTNVVGFSIILGSNSALDTLANQAAGSSKLSLTSLYTLRQLVCQFSMLPVMFVMMWWGTNLLHLISPRTDPEMLALTRDYLRVMFWALPIYSVNDCLRRFCSSIDRVMGPSTANAVGAVVSVSLNYLLVHGPDKYRIGFLGAPIAVVTAYHCIFMCNLIYALLTTPKAAWCGFSMDIFHDLGVNYRLGWAGILALCSEWWAFEALGLGSTYLGQVTQATTAMYCSVLASLFVLPYALSLAAAIRIGTLVGAGKAQAAKLASLAISRLAVMAALLMAACLVLFRTHIAELYTDDPEVVQVFNRNIVILVVVAMGDQLQVVNGGILRGAGLPQLAAQVNVAAYWLVGFWLSLVFVLAFHTFTGLWGGFTIAIVGATSLVRYRIHRIDWYEQVAAAKTRLDTTNNGIEHITESDAEHQWQAVAQSPH